MKYPDYDKDDIQETLDTYLTFDKNILPSLFMGTDITKDSPEYNVDFAVKLYDKETAFKLSHRKFVKLLSEIKNTFLLDENSVIIINKLIGDRKIYKKIRFCTDGSYRNNRIWGHCNRYNKYEIEPMLRYNFRKKFNYKPSIDKDDPKTFIDWLYNHFDTIFLQIPSQISLVKKSFDDYYYDDYYYDDYYYDDYYYDDYDDDDDYDFEDE